MSYLTLSSVARIDAELLESFATLPADEFLKGDDEFRRRTFARADLKGPSVRWTEANEFVQSEELNSYAGGVVRTFAPLGEPARRFTENLVADPSVQDFLGGEEYRLGCHQIRVVAGDEFNGLPAPEGFHHDGFDVVAVTCVALHNVNGAVSLFRTVDRPGTVLERTLSPGESVLFDDRAFQHYVTPFTPRIPGLPAYRDAIVVTFQEAD
jgi:hypothetical protein